uniref:Sugar phosphate exchanger 2 n=1 Tax=Lygus hesperus TaxID=30085 RepID=A0A0A9YXB8_LYGHE
MSRWFPHGKRGFVMCVWNSHTSIGNILGSVISTSAVKLGDRKSGWTYAFLVPSLIGLGMAAVNYIWMIGSPVEVGCLPSADDPYRDEQLPTDVEYGNGISSANNGRGDEALYNVVSTSVPVDDLYTGPTNDGESNPTGNTQQL